VAGMQKRILKEQLAYDLRQTKEGIESPTKSRP